MTIHQAIQKMQQGKKLHHPKLKFEIQYLTVMLGSDIIDNCGNDKNRFFEELKEDQAFASGWSVVDIVEV